MTFLTAGRRTTRRPGQDHSAVRQRLVAARPLHLQRRRTTTAATSPTRTSTMAEPVPAHAQLRAVRPAGCRSAGEETPGRHRLHRSPRRRLAGQHERLHPERPADVGYAGSAPTDTGRAALTIGDPPGRRPRSSGSTPRPSARGARSAVRPGHVRQHGAQFHRSRFWNVDAIFKKFRVGDSHLEPGRGRTLQPRQPRQPNTVGGPPGGPTRGRSPAPRPRTRCATSSSLWWFRSNARGPLRRAPRSSLKEVPGLFFCRCPQA